ncbi:translation elongation factor G [Candidatus Omnitrophus magneticus]|uniref:Elongation factor G n=1 Tax=Candidatus Omnitrophus magneticus TaxID=1609969 RepID=A0A0F0CSY5_9BACT|nr:translation elongation factor G [Candidatus Omnitrophus magneticus]
MAISTKDIRNIVLISHSGEGKTTLVEDLLFQGGTISRKGSISDGTTVSDYNSDEKFKKHSINLSVSFYEKDGVKVNLIDTPGYFDYIGEIISGINCADMALLLVDAVSGIKVGTIKFWKMIAEKNMPAIIIINKLDKENSDFVRVLGTLQESLSKACIPVYYPAGLGNKFNGVVNLITKEGIDKLDGINKNKAAEFSTALIENISESDDKLMEKYLETGELSDNEVKLALRAGIIAGKIIPVIPVSSEKGIGIDEVMNFIKIYAPSPLDMGPREAVNVLKDATSESVDAGSTKVSIAPDTGMNFSAHVLKTISDPFTGQISIFRVMSGSLRSNQSVKNVTKSASEKLGQLFFMKGKDMILSDNIIAGDIGATAKLKITETGDTLCDERNSIMFSKINFGEPAISFSIKPKSRVDEDKISGVLVKLSSEDPSFAVVRDSQTHELVVSGMGEMHLKTVIHRMEERYGVHVEIGTPKVAYKETIMAKGDAQYRHKKQSGGAGQFAEVWMKVEPLERGAGFEFVDEVVGGAIPKPFIGSCEKGIKIAMSEGIIAHFPVVDVRVTVYDGKTHPVDSKDIAFQIAAAHAFRQACQNAKPVLLEPVMRVELAIPESNMGDVTGSLTSHRGRVQGMKIEGGVDVLSAEIPLDEMYKYSNELKSITAGRATYTMSFSHYDPVPSNLAQKIIAENKRDTPVYGE